MKKNLLTQFIQIAGVVILILGYASCANRGQGPQGGPKDEVPPMVIKTTPLNGATQVNQPLVVIEFDELISLENPGQNVVFSPPQKEMPIMKTKGKKLVIGFEDSLRANTTYSIDFGDAIADLNEKNVLKGYYFQFSTGDKIDSLQISGNVIDAKTLAPYKNLTVGIYKGDNDSAFYTQPFDRITKTNEKGEFTIKNVAEGSYQIFALNDALQANFYQQKGTDIAFNDSLITPEAHLHGTIDTLWSNPEKTKFDSLVVDAFYKYYPDNVLLKTFKEKSIQHFLKKSVRNSNQQFTLVFNEPQPVMPTLQLLQKADSNWMVQEQITRADSLVYWIKDPNIAKQDTLSLLVSYIETDTAMVNQAKTDTLSLLLRKKNIGRKNKKKKANADSLVYKFEHNMSKPLEVYDTLHLDFEEPIAKCIPDSIHFFAKEDTLETPIPLYLQYNYDPCPKRLYLIFKKEFGKEYQLRIDSAACFSQFGKVTKPFNKPISVKSLDKYGNLYIQFPIVPEHAIVQLTDNKGKVIMESTIIDEEAYFEDLFPGIYYLRLYIDANENNKWDTGDYATKTQPELTYYFPKEIRIRANWDVEEVWDYHQLPFIEQLPKQLRTPKK